VEAVAPPEPVAWFIGRAVERAVVAAGGSILPPSEDGGDAPGPGGGLLAGNTGRPPPKTGPAETAPPGRPRRPRPCCPGARPAEHDRDRGRTGKQHAAGPVARPPPYSDQRQRPP